MNITTGFPNLETGREQFWQDQNWFTANLQQLNQQYGTDGFVVIYQQAVVGFGKTYNEALENADQNPIFAVHTATPIVIVRPLTPVPLRLRVRRNYANQD